MYLKLVLLISFIPVVNEKPVELIFTIPLVTCVASVFKIKYFSSAPVDIPLVLSSTIHFLLLLEEDFISINLGWNPVVITFEPSEVPSPV